MTEVKEGTEAVMSTLPVRVRRVVLTGFMGAGKSTVGRALAERLGWTFVDLDTVIEERAGMKVMDVFSLKGETAFRRMETIALAAVLGRDGVVVALGGGVPEQLTNRLLLEQTPGTTVVFLDAPFGVLFDRCVLQPGAAVRPVLADPALAEQRFKTRMPHYKRVANVTVATEELSLEETVARVLAGSCAV